ncbi:uncharacterized protein PV06_02533 [Exophiala oligosperma]|uniref:(S)-ureidoglycine aminohydrolase cupin domain-containing protein n=1 Tax=Exophiala oligosperma TaxID=215243 RepID=A0A0D2CAL8_9EURO|nr:uncharacterized protein PV06_02533 [Exophiala oligosperma]KIW46912.1 hypothetical protein PV06_02533 [Exophiala oligosperma]
MIQRGPEPPRPHVVHAGLQNPPAAEWKPFERPVLWILENRADLAWSSSRRFSQTHLLGASWRRNCLCRRRDGGPHRHLDREDVQGRPGQHHQLPKGLEVRWEIDAPFFKKYRVTWNGTDATPEPPVDLQTNHVSDNPEDWGALQDFIRMGGSTGTHLSGGWRSGKGIAATNLDDKGSLTTPYTGTLGDEMILLLEGEVDVTETETGNKHSFRAGDAIGLTSGMHITWISKGPYTKKLWVITRDKIPEA